jgi:5-hydroxyisourate hydrolase
LAIGMMLSVHVVDCAYGVSAADVGVVLRRQIESNWRDLVAGRTGSDGRLVVWRDVAIDTGIYRLVFDLDGYYGILGTIPLYPRAIVEFRIDDPNTDMHLPLMVTSNSYLTCRSGA